MTAYRHSDINYTINSLQAQKTVHSRSKQGDGASYPLLLDCQIQQLSPGFGNPGRAQ